MESDGQKKGKEAYRMYEIGCHKDHFSASEPVPQDSTLEYFQISRS